MDCVNLKANLDADPRPSFVLDLDDVVEGSTHLKPHHLNKSAKADTPFLDVLTSRESESARLRQWANTRKIPPAPGQAYTTHRGPHDTIWIAYDIDNRWRVVQNATIVAPTIPFDVVTPEEDLVLGPLHAIGVSGSFKKLDLVHSPRSTEVTAVQDIFGLSHEAVNSVQGLAKHLEIITAVEWRTTPIGLIEHLPADLLQIIHLILLDPAPQCLFLGENHTLLYNVAYATFAGERHPAIMGQPLFEAWKEAVELNVSIFTFIDSTGRAFIMDDFNISLNRNGFLEEMYLKWTTIPLQGPSRGYLCTASEETARKITERRKALLSRVSEACRGLRNMPSFWKAVLETLATNGKDFPFAFVYSKDIAMDNTYHLEGILDAESSSNLLPATVDCDTSQECFVPVLRGAITANKPVPIRFADGSLPECISDLSEKRGLHDRCLDGLACPIRRASDQMILGILFIGTNTRKTFTPADQAFVGYMIRALGDLATNTINAQESDRLAKQVASQQQTLVQALNSTTLKADHMSAKLQRLVKMLEMVDVGLFEFNINGTLLQANEAFFTLTNHPRGEAPPNSWKQTVYEEYLPLAEEKFRNAVSGEHVNFEIKYKPANLDCDDKEDMRDGNWASIFAVPILDKAGVVTCVSGCVTDITDQKRRQQDAINRAETLEKLRASEKRFHKFAQHALCPIYMYDADRKLQFCNDAYCEIIGGESAKENAKIDGTNILHPDDLERFLDLWREAGREQKSLQYTCRLRRPWKGPDGATGETWVIASAYPEINNEGKITGWIGLLFDISQLKWAERVQELRMEDMVEAKRQQENFIDMTSHEIRNPLGAVVHCADSILTSLVDLETLIKEISVNAPHSQTRQLLDIYESSSDAVNTIISCSTHQRRIVDDVLTWSKLNSNLLKITPSMVRSTAILQDIRNMFEVDAQKAGVTLTVVQDADGVDNVNAEWVMADPGRLMQILINLVTNAIKFTRGEAARQVTVTMGMTLSKPSLDRLPVDFVPSSERTAPDMSGDEWGNGDVVYLYFVVEDTGCGLSSEEKSRIFSRFSQGSPRTHTKYGGSGLGLFISRELVELQSGEIGFASQSGIGSKFGFFIKARKADSGRVGSEAPSIRSGRMSSAVGTGSQRYSILVVEDNQINQAVLSKQLRKLGHEVHLASHGAEALQFIQTTKSWRADADTPINTMFAADKTKRGSYQVELSVILMDVEMPVMDGLTCAAEIRRLQREGKIDSHIPIIAVSANARMEQVDQAIGCGMDDTISKPFRIVDLMPKIERLVS